MVMERLRGEADMIGARNGTRFDFSPFYESRAALTAEPLRAAIEEAARELGVTTMRLPSGAGHDAQSIAQFAPIGMVFVPSVRGISHSPEEQSRPRDITLGTDVLLHALLRIDAG
jgi:N-carbamoyl-L-amino-acid hydrolase